LAARILRAGDEAIREASHIVKGGGLVVYPTDTVYGLGCDPFNRDAVGRLFEVKKREAKPIPVLCDSLKSAAALAQLSGASLSLAVKHWPGALTIVAPLRVNLPFPIHQGTGTVGVRVPGSRQCLELIMLCGGYITGTSANLSGKPSSRSARDAAAQLGDSVDLILDGGTLTGRESTVVRVSGDKIEVLREGAVGVTDEITSK
jgi:L-threonylcarbamoyladenylate synthase